MLAIHDIPALLNQLETNIADDLEGQELDFKQWEENSREMIRILVRSVVSFANAGEGMIIVGVKERTKGKGIKKPPGTLYVRMLRKGRKTKYVLDSGLQTGYDISSKSQRAA